MSVVNKKFVIKHVIKDISSLKEGEQYFSETKKYCGVPWKLEYRRSPYHLCLYLHCDYEDSDKNWSIIVNYKQIVRSVRTAEAEWYRKFNQRNKRVGWTNYLTWASAQNYTTDGNMHIEAHVEIDEMIGIKKKRTGIKFDESMEKFSDVVLVVEEQKFHVSKLYLASKSAYFEALFLKDFDESKVILEDVKATDFQNFLEFIYGESEAISDETVIEILELAYLYKAPLAIQKCEDFGIGGFKKSVKEKNYPTDGNTEMIGIGKKRRAKLTFNESTKKFSDVIFIVEKRKFHVSKLFLASKSAYFEALLLGNFDESKQSEIVLNDIKAEDFQHFLEFIYGEPDISDATVDGISKLADMFNSPFAIQKCEDFLIENSKKSAEEKLELATRYNYEELKDDCISEINKCIHSMFPALDLNEMNPSVVKALFQKAAKLIP